MVTNKKISTMNGIMEYLNISINYNLSNVFFLVPAILKGLNKLGSIPERKINGGGS